MYVTQSNLPGHIRSAHLRNQGKLPPIVTSADGSDRCSACQLHPDMCTCDHRELERKLRAVAQKEWEKHPNNPKNCPNN